MSELVEFASVSWPAWLIDFCACGSPACKAKAARRVGEAWARDALVELRKRIERGRS